MQLSNTLIIIAAEVYLAFAIVAVVFFIHARKLRSLVRRQQEKLIELLRERKNTESEILPSQPTTELAPQHYKFYLNQELDATAMQFAIVAPDGDIAAEQSVDSPAFQRILALRYAFLRTEELGTTESIGTEEYWSIFQQALTPFLLPGNSRELELEAELETCKKRIENLEKFKRLFFDMEKQWAGAKANANDYYAQLMAMSEGMADKEGFTNILQHYNNVYDDIHNTVLHNIHNPDAPFAAHKTINITRQDPRAADEIIKLRNVAADQHRIINQLQRKLVEAQSPEEKEIVIQELQQQLQRQIRFVQESETCVQLLEDELQKVQEELFMSEQARNENANLGEENQLMKSALHNFTMESKDMVSNLGELEEENNALKENIRLMQQETFTPSSTNNSSEEVKQLQKELMHFKEQYAELEERYLDLKLGN